MMIFDCKESKATKIKREVVKEMANQNIYHSGDLPIKFAYEYWGLDLDELETNYTKARRYKIGG